MYGSEKDIKHNLSLFFIDGVAFSPGMTLISITAVIPYFLVQLNATTLQIALATSLALVCNFVSQPFFGHIASHSSEMHKTFGKILLLQRIIFLVFVLCMPLFSGAHSALIWIFLFFWSLFNIFAGSYSVFYTPLLLKLLPPDKRGTIRGLGDAVGSVIGLGTAALIPVLLGRIPFPYNYVLIFSIGLLFLIADALIFFFMRQPEGVEPNIPMGIVQYVRKMPSAILESAPFRAMILTCMFLVAANSLLSYYTLYAIRIFSATESHIATLAALAVISNAVGYIIFGTVADRWGPRITLITTAILVMIAGTLALFTHSLNFLFVAWVFANLGNSGFGLTALLLFSEVSPSARLPLYVGVYTVISLALSSAVLFMLAPALESIGFMVLFATVLACGAFSLLCNLFVLRRQLVRHNQ